MRDAGCGQRIRTMYDIGGWNDSGKFAGWWTSATTLTSPIDNIRVSGMPSYEYAISNTYDNSGHTINDDLNDSGANNGDTTWTYNQGVILGGLTEPYRASGNTGLPCTVSWPLLAAHASYGISWPCLQSVPSPFASRATSLRLVRWSDSGADAIRRAENPPLSSAFGRTPPIDCPLHSVDQPRSPPESRRAWRKYEYGHICVWSGGRAE